MPSEQRYFELSLNLIGRSIRVGLATTGEVLEGVVSNAMFDSFLLTTAKGNRVIPFEHILFIDGIDQAA